MNHKKTISIAGGTFLLFLTACGNNADNTEGENNQQSAEAEEGFPNEPVELVIPYPPGGGTDVLFRLVADYAEEHLGESIVPVNVEGATATVGSREVKDAEPDGYKVLGTHQVTAAAYHNDIVDYGFEAFDPVVMMTSTPHIPSVSREFSEETGVDDIQSFITYVEENPDSIDWAFTTGSEDHYTIAAILDAAGVDTGTLNYINYDGTGPQYSAMETGDVEGMTADYASGEGYFEEGSLVPLGIVDDERSEDLPDVPTLEEQGIDFNLTVDRGVLAPEGTPEEHIEVINEAFQAALEDEELQERIEDLGSVPNYRGTADYADRLEELDGEMEELSDQMQAF